MKLSYIEFLQVKDRSRKIFSFSVPSCRLCSQNMEKIKDIPEVRFVETDNEDDLMNLDIDAVPCTIIYNKDGTVKWKKYGVLNQMQIDEMKRCYGA